MSTLNGTVRRDRMHDGETSGLKDTGTYDRRVAGPMHPERERGNPDARPARATSAHDAIERERRIDDALRMTFPASDPPSW